MTAREKFEKSLGPRTDISHGRDGRYKNPVTQSMWQSWQASRTAAFEEAAKEMDLMNEHHDADNTYAHAAACIRALAEADGEESC